MQTIGNLIASRKNAKPVAASAIVHLVLITVIFHHRSAAIAPIRLPGTDHGKNLLLTYLPGSASAQASVPSPSKQRQLAELKPAPAMLPPQKTKSTPTPNANATATTQTNSTAGNDALGSGDINIALVSYFPTPKPTLSALPRGTRGDVILDIVIDETGKVSDLKMTSGLGYGIDETVIATVQQWIFHPATKNGHPVASEQELHFHYERG